MNQHINIKCMKAINLVIMQFINPLPWNLFCISTIWSIQNILLWLPWLESLKYEEVFSYNLHIYDIYLTNITFLALGSFPGQFNVDFVVKTVAVGWDFFLVLRFLPSQYHSMNGPNTSIHLSPMEYHLSNWKSLNNIKHA